MYGKKINIRLLDQCPRGSWSYIGGLCDDVASIGQIVERNFDLEIAVRTGLDPSLKGVRASGRRPARYSRRGCGVSTTARSGGEEQGLAAGVRPTSGN